MATKGELAGGHPLKAMDVDTVEPHELASTEMAPLTLFKPFDPSPLNSKISGIQT